MTGAAPSVREVAREVDGDAVRATLAALLATREAVERARKRLADLEAREVEQCRTIVGLARSLSGFFVDGYSVTIHTEPGKRPMVHVRRMAVL